MRLLLISVVIGASSAFAPNSLHSKQAVSSTELKFGIPSFLTPKEADEESDAKAATTEKEEKKITLAGIVQLITAGAGAPFLGDFEGVDEETGKMMFSLEANNLVDSEGNSIQTKAPYFENGWVDPEDEKRAQEGFKFPWQK